MDGEGERGMAGWLDRAPRRWGPRVTDIRVHTKVMGLGEPRKSEPPGGVLGTISYLSWGWGHRRMDGKDTMDAESPSRR